MTGIEKDINNDGPTEMLERAYRVRDDRESKRLYCDWAQTYDQTMVDGLGYLTPQKTAALLASHESEKDITVLDVGAGTGLAGAALSRHGFNRVDALDYSAEMLAVAEKTGRYRRCIQADLNEPLPFDDQTYGAIICTGTFTHAHVGAQCLDELFRVLKCGGSIACTIHKNVWEPAGFSKKIETLAVRDIISVVSKREGTYYKNSSDSEGFYILAVKQ